MHKIKIQHLSLQLFRYIISVIILLAMWTIFVRIFNIKPFILPEPTSVISILFTESNRFLGATFVTLRNVVFGAICGISLGITVGLLLAYSKKVRWIVEPYLTIFQSFPREALFPLFVVWFGFGITTKVINATLLSFLPMAMITLAATTNVRKDYIELIKTWGADKRQEFLHCRLPSAIPQIIAGVKIAVPLALIGAVLAEFMGGNDGLGYIIISSGSTFNINRLFGAVIILAFTGLLILGIINSITSRLFRRYFSE